MKVIAFVLLAIDLAATCVVGLFAIMGAASDFQLLIFSAIPTAIVPVGYFLVVHGILAHDEQHATQGVFAAVVIFAVNLIIFRLGFEVIRVLVAHGVPGKASWPVYAVDFVNVLAQLILLVYFRRRLRRAICTPARTVT